MLKDALFLENIKILKFENILVRLLDIIWTWLVELLALLQTDMHKSVLSTIMKYEPTG